MANIAIDWIVYRSGDNASLTDDYRPISSSGLIAADLTDEVVRVCRAHYQISEPMPAEQDVWFFWPAREAKGAYVAMQGRRVPDPSGQKRPAAAYTALLLSDEKYDLFSRNPVALFEDHGRGFEKAAEYAAQQSRDPIIVSRSDSASSAAPPSPAGSAAFESGQPVAWSPVADADLRRYIAAQIVVPSFVTWWPSASPPPAGLFRIVLQATVAVRRTVLEELDWLSNRLLELGNEALGSPEAQRNILYNGMQEILQRASSAALGAQGLLREGLEEKNRDRWPEAQRQIRAAAEESSKQLDLGLSAPLRALPPHLVAGFEQVKKGFSDFATRIEMERHPARPSFQSEATAEGARRVPAGRTTETAHPPAEDRRPDGPRRDDKPPRPRPSPRSFGPAHWMAVGGGAVAALALVVFTAGSLLRGAHPAVGGPADTVTLTDISKLDLPGKIAARQKDVDRFTAQGKSLDTQIAQLQSQKAAAAQEAGAAQQATAAQMATYNQAKAKRDAAQARYDGAKEREARARAALNGGGGVDRAAIDSEIAQCKARLESLKAQPDIDQGDPGESNADKLRTAQEAVTELQQTLHETKVQRANLFTRAGLATGEERTSINSAIDGADAEIKRLTQQLSSANAALAALRHPNGNSKGGKAHGGSKQAEMHKINLRIAELKRRHDAPVPDRGKLQADLDQAAGAVAAARAALDLCPVPARPGASPAQARLDQITLKLAEALHTQKGVKDKLAQAGAELKQFQSMQKLSQK